MPLELNEYQRIALSTAIYPDPIVYPALKLNGEAGEVAEKIGKLMQSSVHECRLTALLILVQKYVKGDAAERKLILPLGAWSS